MLLCVQTPSVLLCNVLVNCQYVLSWHFCAAWISGTTQRGDTGGGPSSACKHEGPWASASLRLHICQDVQLLGLPTRRKPCFLEQQLFCTDTRVMLMFDNKRSVIKLELMLFFFPFPPPQCILNMYTMSVFLRKAKPQMWGGHCWFSSAQGDALWRVPDIWTTGQPLLSYWLMKEVAFSLEWPIIARAKENNSRSERLIEDKYLCKCWNLKNLTYLKVEIVEVGVKV